MKHLLLLLLIIQELDNVNGLGSYHVMLCEQVM